MLFSSMLPLMMVLASAPEPRWEQSAKADGVTVFSRQKEGAAVAEVKAVGLIDAPPAAVKAYVLDYPNYPKRMPYTEETLVLSSEQEGKVLKVYSLINPPFVSRRDFVIRVEDQSDWKDGKGFLKVAWKAADGGPPPRKDLVRVTINEGYWLMEPRDGGTRTFLTYYLYTDPGGSLPKWVANRANNTAIPKLFEKIREGLQKKP